MDEKKGFGAFIDFLFSKDIRKYLILILLLGLVLRFFAVTHISPLADEMIFGTHAINILSSGVINTLNESPAWFYLTDIAYKLFGMNALGARFLSFLFGGLTIILIYMIGKEIYNEKIGLIASFLVAVSFFHLRYALMEMDEALAFFSLLGFFFLIKGFKQKTISYLAFIFFGVSILIKPISLPFIASAFLCIFFFYRKNENKKELIQKNKKKAIIALIILFLFAMPILAFNYILYSQKGITDQIFSRFLGIRQDVYSGLAGYDATFELNNLLVLAPKQILLGAFPSYEPIISVLALIGIFIILFNKKYTSGKVFLLFALIPLIFLMGTSLLATHFSPFIPFLALSAAVSLDLISSKFKKINPHHIISLVLIAVFIVSMFMLYPYISSKSALFTGRDYISSNTNPNDIIIADGRIYRGRMAWLLNDRPYLEASYFQTLLDLNNNLTSQEVQANIYFVECAADDCGWGTIRNQPEFNASMESIVSFFKQNTKQEKIILGGGAAGEDSKSPYFIIYKGVITIHPEIYQAVYQTHDWIYYPVRLEKPDWFDKYVPIGAFQNSLNLLVKTMLWLAIILAILSPIVLFKELISPNKKFFKNLDNK